ncbi:uncharacterized protein LOC111911505 [Lactuca sativa]|uniref:uncharacterized protein LOC111911505 n=1 Tax=Lactuca sativa TaxID=4236 RepID=UPI000CD9900F|nr:uncharacterized protein LOC111911505 [Lactuca sativa]
MASLKLDERFWCTYFPTTLEGNVGTWIKTLKLSSINNFNQLKYLFITNFMQLRKYKGDCHTIIGCKQREGHTVKDYFARLIKATLDVPVYDEGLIAKAFTWGLMPGSLSQKLMGKQPNTRAELNEMVERFLPQDEGEASKQVYLNAIIAFAGRRNNYNTTHPDFRGNNRFTGQDRQPTRRFRPFTRDDR